MQRNVLCFSPDQDIAAAVQVMLHHRVSGGPVVANGRVVGMFSERDALSVLATAAYESEPSGTVSQHMRVRFQGVAPDTDLFTLADLFAGSPVRRLPVIDRDSTLLGLVLRGDVMRALQAMIDSGTPRPVEPKTAYERVARHLGPG